uniref:female open reading frame n=1 Tax=Lampsilis cariosa TaxID=448067 RepID=UPI00226D1221|nr:female open reading frame [Lampsilis cariosa]UZC55512.1 female open reading frame [Lampsilis cariosa]
MVIKTKTRITNMLQHKMTQKLIIIIISTTSLLLMALLLSPFLLVSMKVPYTELLLTDNPLDKNQTNDTSTTSTGCHPIKNSPASTNISDKT